MKHAKFLLATIISTSCLLLTGCGGPAPTATIQSPPNGAVIELSTSAHPDPSHDWLHWNPGVVDISINYPERAHTWIVQDNGQSILPANVSTLGNTGQTISFRWEPATLGRHTITAQAGVSDDNGQVHWSDTTSVTVCVVNDPASPLPNVPIGVIGNCVIPPTITPTPNPIDSVQAYPNPIYYGNTCPSLSTITFRAAITLPNGVTADQVQVAAHANFIITSPASPSGSLLIPLLPDGTWDSSSGGQVFLGTAALTHSYNDANNQVDLASLGGNSGAILWYVTITQNNASGQARSANQVLSLSPCPASGHNPPHNGSGSPSGCGQYTNQTSCNLAGCSWNPQNSSCTVNP